MRLIDADALREVMYHEAFEKDTDMQKWDGGCWIRYKMFENAIKSAPTIDAVQVVRCKDCEYKRLYDGETKYYYCALEDRPNRQWGVDDTDFCSWGERKDHETD